MEEVILVDTNDNQLGVMEKLEAHQKSLLHRAFSVFVFNDRDELLLQQRNPNKYHSGGLWTNTCCGHPRPNETVEAAASRRLFEEMGFTTELQKQFSFIYKTQFANGLTEHELDYVFFGKFNGIFTPNPSEVSGIRYHTLNDIEKDIQSNPDNYTSWFKICFEEVMKKRNSIIN
ncbi:MAG: isopentenyl-diphosphate Delta-isomerase [Bacteroidota bacterium]|nr:isopentenyl-diphosphate Delta-isomerase [Bacteroidota bacterium]